MNDHNGSPPPANHPSPIVLPFRGTLPKIDATAFLAPTAVVIGDVEIGAQSSLWFYTVVRGDIHRIRIGCRTNIQDFTMVHVTHETGPTSVGDDITIGHGAVVHACTIHDRSLVGMRAVILDGAEVGPESIVGAGALVPPGMRVPPRTLAVGVPARIVRTLTDEDCEMILDLGLRYLENTMPGYQNP